MNDSEIQDKRAIARSAGLAFLGRLGALVDAISVPVFERLYGLATWGVFLALFALMRVTSYVAEFAMATCLQRFVPAAETDEEIVHGYLRTAFAISGALSLAAASLIALGAPYLASVLNASDADTVHLTNIVRLYAWVLPLWVFVEVATGAVRARRVFGPEIRIRIFYEQGLRLIAGVGFFFAGFLSYGLFLGHLASLLIAALLSLRLLSRHYDLRRLITARLTRERRRELFSIGAHMMPANASAFALSELPVLILNVLIPGVAGAVAAGLYGVARKVASVLHIVRESFEYVLAPLASERNANAGIAAVQAMYAYATRLSCGFVIILGAGLVATRHDILELFSAESAAAAAVIIVLAAGRAFEACTGPSASVIKMLGHRALPAVNSLVGIAVMASLQFWLAPRHGAFGAAIATAIALNVTALLYLAQCHALHGLRPHDANVARPLLAASVGFVIILLVGSQTTALPALAHFAVCCALLVAAFWSLVRFGLDPADTDALGRLGKLAGRRRRQVNTKL